MTSHNFGNFLPHPPLLSHPFALGPMPYHHALPYPLSSLYEVINEWSLNGEGQKINLNGQAGLALSLKSASPKLEHATFEIYEFFFEIYYCKYYSQGIVIFLSK